MACPRDFVAFSDGAKRWSLRRMGSATWNVLRPGQQPAEVTAVAEPAPRESDWSGSPSVGRSCALQKRICDM